MAASDKLAPDVSISRRNKKVKSVYLRCQNCKQKVWIDFEMPTYSGEAYKRDCPECGKVVGMNENRRLAPCRS